MGNATTQQFATTVKKNKKDKPFFGKIQDIKEHLGITKDHEVIRYCITQTWKSIFQIQKNLSTKSKERE